MHLELQPILESLAAFAAFLLAILLLALALGALLIYSTWRRVRDLDLPDDAGFFTTLRALPLVFVIGLDLLDFSLDFLAAPLAWWLLDRLGLKGLRNTASLEMLIPFTQPIPTMTIGWILARLLDLGRENDRVAVQTGKTSKLTPLISSESTEKGGRDWS